MAGEGNMTTLSNGMKGLAEADLTITEDGRKAFNTHIESLRQTIKDVSAKIEAVRHIPGPVGNLQSATETKGNVDGAVNDATAGIVAVLDNYGKYLDEFQKTLDAAVKRLAEQDSATPR